MMDSPAANEDPAIVGVPPETPEQIKPSATGIVVGPVEGETNVVVSEERDDRSPPVTDDTARDQLLEDAEGGIEGSLLDAPDDDGVAPI